MKINVVAIQEKFGDDICNLIETTYGENNHTLDLLSPNEISIGDNADICFLVADDDWQDSIQILLPISNTLYLISNEKSVGTNLMREAKEYQIKALSFSNLRAELITYAKRNGILIVDNSNDDDSYDKTNNKNVKDSILKSPNANHVIAELERDGTRKTSTILSKTQTLTIAFVGTKGGTGTTSLAINTALAIQRNSNDKLRVGVIDFQTYGGSSISHKLDMWNGRTIKDFIDDIPLTKCSEYFLRHDTGIQILAGLINDFESSAITNVVVDKIFQKAVNMFDVLILDVPPCATVTTVKSLFYADLVFLVQDNSIDGIDRINSYVYDVSETSKMNLILNKCDDVDVQRLSDGIGIVSKKHGIKYIGNIEYDKKFSLACHQDKAVNRIPYAFKQCNGFKNDLDNTILKVVNQHLASGNSSYTNEFDDDDFDFQPKKGKAKAKPIKSKPSKGFKLFGKR